MTTPSSRPSDNRRLACPGHYPACYHATDFVACDACIERRKGGPLFCPDLDNCAGPGCFDHLSTVALGDDLSDALRQFHAAYGCPVRDKPTQQPEEYDLRISLLREEFSEYVSAASQGDVVEVADALADMVYVIFGTALSYGIDLPAVLAEVHRSNMSKLGADGKPVLRDDGKVMKGPNYFRPAVWRILLDGRPTQPPLTGGSDAEPDSATAGNANSPTRSNAGE